MRSCGIASAKMWLRVAAHKSLLQEPRVGDVWTAAWCFDSDLAKCAIPEARDHWVATSLSAEIQVRTLAAAEMVAR